MKRNTKRIGARWLWLVLLPLPLLMGYAESGDPLAAMSQISNRAAKGDRLPILGADGGALIAPSPRPSERQ
ncbi:hypothetical protein METY_3671 [Methylopila sp. Yamaguchi]|nr:hypothetical protein METY_3671 [Methylopila sp. Yamaguchi]